MYAVTIASGSQASSPFTIDRPAGMLCVFVPSMSPATDIRLEVAQASGTGFAPLVRADGSGVPFSVHSGSGPAVAQVPVVSPWGRLFASVAQADLRSFGIATIT